MKKFLKLNAYAALYGFLFFIEIEIMMNVYRFSRVTNMRIDQISKISTVAMLVIFIDSTVLLFIISKRHFNKGGIRFLIIILWFPYFLIFTWLTAMIFPMVNHGDDPGPGMGLILIALLAAYPLYIAIITGLSTKIEDVWDDL